MNFKERFLRAMNHEESVRGTKKEVESAVKKAIRDAARGGGYILSQSHSHSLVDPKRLEWMIEASHKYGKYPVNI